MRRLIAFPCAGETLVGTLDEAAGTTGLLIVSGGNEVRSGAHRGMAELAVYLADAGVPVFRYDRRGIGDSSGGNGGFESAASDIAAAAATFTAEVRLNRLVAFGNCDAASALMLFGHAVGIDALILSNPWTGGTEDALPAPAAIRARYAEKLRDPREWLRLVRGGVNIGKLLNGLRKASAKPSQAPDSLVARMAAALDGRPATVLLAERDNTAIAFRDAWKRLHGAPDLPIIAVGSSSHSFATPHDKTWLKETVLALVRGYSAA